MMNEENAPVVLVTGGAKRVGAAIVRRLHDEGWRVAIHYRASAAEASLLAATLNATRADSAMAVQADLLQTAKLGAFVDGVTAAFGRLDALVNNASTFYPTPLAALNEADWATLIGSNLQAPLFLSQAAARHLTATRGLRNTHHRSERQLPADRIRPAICENG